MKSADHEIKRIIREVEPPRPSTRLTTVGEAIKIATARQINVRELSRELRSELEWIPLKAMRKERMRRYGSAQAFAKDIDNYLQGRPLYAGPETHTYRTKKFVKRHRYKLVVMLVTIPTAAVFLVLHFQALNLERLRSVNAEHQALEGQVEREAAEETAGEVKNFMGYLLRTTRPGVLNGADKLKGILSVGATYFNELPESKYRLWQADVLDGIAVALDYRGYHKDARAAFMRVIAILRYLDQSQTGRYAVVLDDLGKSYWSDDHLLEAKATFKEAARLSESVKQESFRFSRWVILDHLAKVTTDSSLSIARSEEAIKVLRETPDCNDLLKVSLFDLGRQYESANRLKDAELVWREGFAVEQGIAAKSGTLKFSNNSTTALADLLDQTNRHAEAVALRAECGLPEPSTRPSTRP